jgi:hypothetical protein
MFSTLARSTAALAVLATAFAATAASAQDAPKTGKARCAELVGFYDRYGVTRSEHSDGAKNHYRIRAGFECERGNYEAGIRQIETQLMRKKFELPLYTSGGPWYFPTGHAGPQFAEQP